MVRKLGLLSPPPVLELDPDLLSRGEPWDMPEIACPVDEKSTAPSALVRWPFTSKSGLTTIAC